MKKPGNVCPSEEKSPAQGIAPAPVARARGTTDALRPRMNQEDKAMRLTNTLDRRRFVYLVSGMGLGLPILGGGNGFSKALPPSTDDDDTQAANDIRLIALTHAYVNDAISNASSIAGCSEALNQHFDDGRSIFIMAQQRLAALDYDITLPDGPIDLVTPPETFTDFSNFEQINMAALSGESDAVRKILAKLLALFGISDFAEVFAKLLAADLEGLGAAALAQNWKLVTRLFFKIIDSLFSSAFFTLLGEQIGAKVAAKLAVKIAAKFLPFIGWAILIAQLVWALGEEFGEKS